MELTRVERKLALLIDLIDQWIDQVCDRIQGKPGDINDDGLEIEQDGWITRIKKVITKEDKEGGKDEE